MCDLMMHFEADQVTRTDIDRKLRRKFCKQVIILYVDYVETAYNRDELKFRLIFWRQSKRMQPAQLQSRAWCIILYSYAVRRVWGVRKSYSLSLKFYNDRFRSYQVDVWV